MLIGTVAALATGACFALVIFLYQIVTGALVNYGKDQQRNSSLATPLNFSNQTTSTTLFTTMTDLVKWYVLLGGLSILFYTIAFSCYMISSERQIRRIRFRLFRSIIHQDMAWFDVLDNTGTLSKMLTDDLTKVKDGIGDKVADFLSLLARMIGCLVFALVTGWKLTLVILAISPLVVLAFNLILR
ncbi:unnamed protein product, partial [Didymodactylos carnosus]